MEEQEQDLNLNQEESDSSEAGNAKEVLNGNDEEWSSMADVEEVGRRQNPISELGSLEDVSMRSSVSVSDVSETSVEEENGEPLGWRVTRNASLNHIYSIHGSSVLDDIRDRYGREATLDEFWNSFVNEFVEPCGWIGNWQKLDWTANKLPAPILKNTMVEAVRFVSDSLRVMVVVRDPEEESPPSIDTLPTLSVPIWEIEPLEAIDGVVMNIRVFKEAMEQFRFFRNYLCTPSYRYNSCEEWFELHKLAILDLYHDLEHPGALSTKIKDEVVSLICSIRQMEEELDCINFPVSSDNRDSLPNSSWDRQAYLQIELERQGNRMKYLADPTFRSAIEIQEKKQFASQLHNELQRYDLVIVLKETEMSFKLWRDVQIAAAPWLLKKNIEMESVVFTISRNLDAALQSCSPDSIVLVGPGQHYMTGIGNLEEGGSLIGVPSNGKKVVISTEGTGDVWFLVRGKAVYLWNVDFIIEPGFGESVMKQAVKIVSGILQATNCSFTNVSGMKFGKHLNNWEENKPNIDGMEVSDGCKLDMVMCQLVGFKETVRLEGDSCFTITDSEMRNCSTGLVVVGPKFEVKLSNVKVQNVIDFMFTTSKMYRPLDLNHYGTDYTVDEEDPEKILVRSLVLQSIKIETM